MKKVFPYLLGIFVFLSFIGFRPEDPLIVFLKKLEQLTSNQNQQKIYLSFDKPYYAAGDDIWFKAYILDIKKNRPLLVDQVMYVELIDENNQIKKRLTIPTNSGLGSGNFTLPDSLTAGMYSVRAYTNWMRNYSSDFYFDRTFKVGNFLKDKVTYSILPNSYDNKLNLTGEIRILFRDQNSALEDCTVSYKILDNGKELSSAKGKTDNEGILALNLPPEITSLKHTVFLSAKIQLPNKQLAEKRIALNLADFDVDVQFFPEGGHQIIDIPSKIAFKAVNNLGLGEYITGEVIDEKGNSVMKFESSNLGMGNFMLTPMDGKRYQAKIKLRNGATKTFELPKPKADGHLLSINNILKENLAIKTICSNNMLNKPIYLIAHHNGNVYFSSKLSHTKQLEQVNIKKPELPSGIVEITLFDEQFIPLAERIIFVDNITDKIEIKTNDVLESYNPKSSFEANISVHNQDQATNGSFSVCVTNSDLVLPDYDNESNILTSLLLTSDLSGFVEKPNGYFQDKEETTITKLDNLMLTQGWRKIDWKTVAKDSIDNHFDFKPEQGISLTGNVSKNKKPVADGIVTYLSRGNGLDIRTAQTDKNGAFEFRDLDLIDTANTILRAVTGKGSNDVDVKIFNEGPKINKKVNFDYSVDQNINSYLEQSAKYFGFSLEKGWVNSTKTLKTVEIVEKRKKVGANSLNLNGAGNADQIFTSDDLKNIQSGLSNFLFPRLRAQSMAGNLSIRFDGAAISRTELDMIPVEIVASVEILTSPNKLAIYGVRGGSGLMIITTKNGSEMARDEKPPKGTVSLTSLGFSVEKKFYSPKYQFSYDSTPDYRSTIFWASNLETDLEGKAKINYYNGQSGKYRMIIEGIDADGYLGRKVLTYEVK